MQFKVVNEVTVMYVTFNDTNAGLMAMESDCLVRQQNSIPIKKHKVSFGLKKINLNHTLKELRFRSHYHGCVLFIKCNKLHKL